MTLQVANSVQPAPSLQPMNWESLSLLRFFLAWIVLCGHFLWFFVPSIAWARVFDSFGGKAAVVGFLLVSGFSIAASLDRGGQIEDFYRRRLLRIYPLYFCAIVFAIVLEISSGGHLTLPHRDLGTSGATGWLGNLLLLQTFVVRPVEFDGPVWSLAVEVFFYLLAPLFARMSTGRLMVLILVSLACFTLPVHTDWGFAYRVLSKFNALIYLWPWLLGFALWRQSRGPILLCVLSGIPAMLLSRSTPEALSVAVYVLSVLALLSARSLKFPYFVRPTCELLGDISYPLYLFHVPSFIFAYEALQLRSALGLLLVAFIIIIFAYYIVDRYLKSRYIKPLLMWRTKAALRNPVTL